MAQAGWLGPFSNGGGLVRALLRTPPIVAHPIVSPVAAHYTTIRGSGKANNPAKGREILHVGGTLAESWSNVGLSWAICTLVRWLRPVLYYTRM
jgi:hypothetical protein